MTRRELMRFLAGLPVAAVAVAAGVESAPTTESLYDSILRAHERMERLGGPWVRIYPKNPQLAFDPAVRVWLDEIERNPILMDVGYCGLEPGKRITTKSGLPTVAWRRLGG